MKKWYQESYFDRKNWILENFDKLNLSSDETLLILLVDLCRTNRKTITYDYLMKKLQKTSKQIDTIVAGLVNKHYLKISNNSRGLVFDIDEIFEFDPERYEISDNKNLFDTVSEVFGKPLSPTELQKVSELSQTYGEQKFIEALRLAEAKRAFKIGYIESILRNEK
ncbi:MAG: DnaD domain protein [Erysipelotrichaceae bacterium]|nr:DnaD domain protein [Erysipelotrichaceae bacterium]MBP5279456.1 DnaD domain protein [Erysipelotrichaceae bacterium]